MPRSRGGRPCWSLSDRFVELEGPQRPRQVGAGTRGRNLSGRGHRNVAERGPVAQQHVDEGRRRRQRREDRLEEPGLPDPERLLNHPERRTQTPVVFAPRAVVDRSVDLRPRLFDEEHVELAHPGPGQAEVGPARDVRPSDQPRPADRGDRPVDHRATVDPPYRVQREPDSEREALRGRPLSLRGHREERIGGLDRAGRSRRRRRRPVREQPRLPVGIGARGREEERRGEKCGEPHPRSHSLSVGLGVEWVPQSGVGGQGTTGGPGW